jgi:hypothetical protein
MNLSQLCSLILSCALAGTAGTAAFGQATSNYTSVETTSDKPVQLSYHATARKNCTPAPLPTVRVIEPPKSGMLTVRRAVLTTDKVAGCPQVKVPAQVVFYRSRPGYAGLDHVSYEVTSENGEDAIYDVAITVKAAPAPAEPQGEAGTRL